MHLSTSACSCTGEPLRPCSHMDSLYCFCSRYIVQVCASSPNLLAGLDLEEQESHHVAALGRKHTHHHPNPLKATASSHDLAKTLSMGDLAQPSMSSQYSPLVPVPSTVLEDTSMHQSLSTLAQGSPSQRRSAKRRVRGTPSTPDRIATTPLVHPMRRPIRCAM